MKPTSRAKRLGYFLDTEKDWNVFEKKSVCSKCGKTNFDVKFCPYCGTKAVIFKDEYVVWGELEDAISYALKERTKKKESYKKR